MIVDRFVQYRLGGVADKSTRGKERRLLDSKEASSSVHNIIIYLILKG